MEPATLEPPDDAASSTAVDSPIEDSNDVSAPAILQSLSDDKLASIVTDTIVLNSDTTWLELPAFSDSGDASVEGKRPEIRNLVVLFGWWAVLFGFLLFDAF
jgi:hypothetical protein